MAARRRGPRTYYNVTTIKKNLLLIKSLHTAQKRPLPLKSSPNPVHSVGGRAVPGRVPGGGRDGGGAAAGAPAGGAGRRAAAAARLPLHIVRDSAASDAVELW